jgi:hypothetical protein
MRLTCNTAAVRAVILDCRALVLDFIGRVRALILACLALVLVFIGRVSVFIGQVSAFIGQCLSMCTASTTVRSRRCG